MELLGRPAGRSRGWALAPLCGVLLAAALAAGTAPARAQAAGDPAAGDAPKDDGAPKLSDTLDEALRALVEKMEPALKSLRETLEVFEQIDSIENYQRPEILPNGDIVIRRRHEAPPWQPPADDKDGIKT